MLFLSFQPLPSSSPLATFEINVGPRTALGHLVICTWVVYHKLSLWFCSPAGQLKPHKVNKGLISRYHQHDFQDNHSYKSGQSPPVPPANTAENSWTISECRAKEQRWLLRAANAAFPCEWLLFAFYFSSISISKMKGPSVLHLHISHRHEYQHKWCSNWRKAPKGDTKHISLLA